jgi:hypothetical protein
MSEHVNNLGHMYYCDICDYFARDAYNMRKHVDTRKHIQMCNVAGKSSEDAIIVPIKNKNDTPKTKSYECDECDAVYAYRQSLWRHKQNMHS